MPSDLIQNKGSRSLSLRTPISFNEIHAQVSTVDLLGIDHFGDFFETAVYDGSQYHIVDRYPTISEAIDGHSKWVEELRKYLRGEQCLLTTNS